MMQISTPAGLFGTSPGLPLSEWTVANLERLEQQIGRNGEPSDSQKQQLATIRKILAQRKA